MSPKYRGSPDGCNHPRGVGLHEGLLPTLASPQAEMAHGAASRLANSTPFSGRFRLISSR
jgi:hypothetical protein